MKLMELYNQIQNPINDIDIIKKVIYAYSKTSGNFYYNLTHNVQKENVNKYYIADSDFFYAMMFNKWKNSIVAMKKDEFIELYKNGKYGKDFIKMREYLKTVPDVKTKEEANNVFFGRKNDEELEDALDKYRWTSFGEGSGWIHVCSRYVTAKKDEYPKVEHRLYLDTECLDTLKMATYIVNKCDEHHLPYYFKFSEKGNRSDTLVIYSSTENLTKYIEILQEIKKEHPDLVARTKEVPMLTGKIDNWIGYGSEPNKAPNGENRSFNEIRSEMLERVIKKCTNEWLYNHMNTNYKVRYGNQELTLQEYIVRYSTERLIEKMEGEKDFYDGNVRSPEFKEFIYKNLEFKLGPQLYDLLSGKKDKIECITLNGKNNSKMYFYPMEILKELAYKIANGNPQFVKRVQEQIKVESRKYGIDENNFCFDKRIVERMKTVDTSLQNRNENIDEKHINVQSILKLINPNLLNEKMKLPNGAIISARQYIQEIVFPSLPENGIIMLKNGEFQTAVQFIEECVMFDCQRNYNGDFVKYLYDNTRNNPGVISIGPLEVNYKIRAEEIVDLINPDVLNRKIKLPNNAEISAKQYIQEIYAPLIPANGRVTLKNGTEISVKQYIEEVLISDVQERYNGDIAQILANTTMNNKGTINTDKKDVQKNLIEIKKQIESLKEKEVDSGIGIKH